MATVHDHIKTINAIINQFTFLESSSGGEARKQKLREIEALNYALELMTKEKEKIEKE